MKVFESDPPSGNCWRVTEPKLKELIADSRIWFGSDGNNVPRRKVFLNEQDAGLTPHTLWTADEVGTTDSAKRSLNAIFDGITVFDTPKPVELLTRICQISMGTQDIALDFFAGCAPLSEAVLRANLVDGGKRTHYTVQLPEPCEKKTEAYQAGFRTISEIGKERIRRAASKIKQENQEYDGDLGFKVFKLDSSNIRAWNPDRNDLEQTLIDHIEHLVEDRSEEDVLYELLLKRGVDLTVPIEKKTISDKIVYSIGYGVLFACLDTKINRDQIEDLAMGIIDWHKELEPASDTQVVFRDSAFEGDIAKTNMTAILEQNGIKHVRSL